MDGKVVGWRDGIELDGSSEGIIVGKAVNGSAVGCADGDVEGLTEG